MKFAPVFVPLLMTLSGTFPVPTMASPIFVELGLKAGVAFSKLSGSNLERTDSGPFDLGGGFTGAGFVSSGIQDMKAGFLGGAYGTVHFNERLAVRLEALYSMKGGKGGNSGTVDVYDPSNLSNPFIGTITLTGTNQLSLAYVELPLLGVATFPTGETSAFEVFAGPSIAFKTSAKTTQRITLSSTFAPTQSGGRTINVADSFKSTDWGATFGAGMIFEHLGHPIFLEARWTMGFTEIDNTGSGQDWKNSALALGAGIGFPIVSTSR